MRACRGFREYSNGELVPGPKGSQGAHTQSRKPQKRLSPGHLVMMHEYWIPLPEPDSEISKGACPIGRPCSRRHQIRPVPSSYEGLARPVVPVFPSQVLVRLWVVENAFCIGIETQCSIESPDQVAKMA